jgi:excisionase family DNA binding protein
MKTKRKTERKYPPGFVCAEGAAEFLGVSLRTIRKWTYEGIIPHYVLGHFVFYKTEELLQTLEKNRVG